LATAQVPHVVLQHYDGRNRIRTSHLTYLCPSSKHTSSCTNYLTTPQEIIGYIARTLSAKRNPYKVSYFVIQYFFIVVAPVFFAAAIYTVLSVLIRAVPDGVRHAPLRPKLILWIFITCDVVATVIQIVGAALIGVAYSNRRDPSTPNHILLAGLVFQAATFAVFVGLLGLFIWRARAGAFKAAGKVFYASFGLAVMFIYLRICFRLAETAQGLEGELQSHEVYFGTLEFMPVIIALALLAVWHPGRCFQRGNIGGTKRSKKEERDGVRVEQ
jgi:hypothetical protein